MITKKSQAVCQQHVYAKPMSLFLNWAQFCTFIGLFLNKSKSILIKTQDLAMVVMPWPGFEPGLSRPQREVLTTIRSRPVRPCIGLSEQDK